MVRILLQALVVLLLSGLPGLVDAWDGAGCTEPFSRAHEDVTDDWRLERLRHGKEIYTYVCASCHDPGASAAPDIGRKEDWSSRSRLWCAVLFEHAKSGYLGMPAKGGREELTGKDVDAAAEYMLGVTFPELPPD